MLAPVADLAAQQATPSAPPMTIGRFEDLIALAANKRDIGIKLALERDVRLVRCEDGRLEITLEKSASKTLVNDLARKFSQWTSRRWMVVVSAEEGAPTVKAQTEARQAELQTGVRADPLVQAVLNRFPGAEIVGVRAPDEPLPLDEAPLVDDDSSYGADWRHEE
jgi:DNA polymerase-3 subunit gamma/tau